jgi:acetyl-CoA synthetase
MPAYRQDLAGTELARFMAVAGCADLAEMRRRSVADIAWFWGLAERFVGLEWDEPYSDVLDLSRGKEWATWFKSGRLNFAHNALDRHERDAPDRPAVIWESEDGEVRTWSYARLRAEADALAGELRRRGIGQDEVVAVYMPMTPEAVGAFLAIAKIGAVFLPLFSGFGVEALTGRLNHAQARAVICADGVVRRGKKVDMLGPIRAAVNACPSVSVTLTLSRIGVHQDWPEPAVDRLKSLSVESEQPLFLGYTSGTTGEPKAAVMVHAGWLVQTVVASALHFDCGPADRLCWLSDMGWIMGAWQVTAALGRGATLVMYEGAPDWPQPDRVWDLVERHRITILGVNPTLVRALAPHGRELVQSHNRSSLRAIGATGEPWNPDAWEWLYAVAGDSRCSIVNISGGTEVGGNFLGPYPGDLVKPASLGGPALGMDVDVFDEAGRPIRGGVGELVCRQPWPAMTRGLLRAPERYLDTYWSRWPGIWWHGDWASVDDDGVWFLHGRSDDTIKLAGKRLGPADVEAVLMTHPSVVEAAAVGIPDPVKGEALWCFVVRRVATTSEPDDGLRGELSDLLARELGHPFRPAAVRFCSLLPKTRSAKILRRLIRALVTDSDLGDLSSMEDPAALEAIRTAV